MCGNDPVKMDIARVDFSEMLTFLRIGKPATRTPASDMMATQPGGRFSGWGWDVSEFLEFHSWERMKGDVN